MENAALESQLEQLLADAERHLKRCNSDAYLARVQAGRPGTGVHVATTDALVSLSGRLEFGARGNPAGRGV